MTSEPSPVRVAQIGCGHWGKNLARNFAELGALEAVVDADPELAAAHAHGQQVRDWPAVLEDPAIHAVSLASPAATHAALAQQALAAGKHVFVEKPLALTVADGRAVIAAAERAGRILMVGHLMHYHPLFAALREMVQGGRLGRLRRISSVRQSLGKFRVEENVLWSFAPHDIAMILALAGREPVQIDASQQDILTPGIADHARIEMDFAGGLVADVSVSWLMPVKQQRLVVTGEAGMAVLDDSEPDWTRKLAFYAHSIDRSGPAPVPRKAEAEFVELPKQEPLLCECRHFLDCIAQARQPLSDGHEGLAVLKVLAAADRHPGVQAA